MFLTERRTLWLALERLEGSGNAGSCNPCKGILDFIPISIGNSSILSEQGDGKSTCVFKKVTQGPVNGDGCGGMPVLFRVSGEK